MVVEGISLPSVSFRAPSSEEDDSTVPDEAKNGYIKIYPASNSTKTTKK